MGIKVCGGEGRDEGNMWVVVVGEVEMGDLRMRGFSGGS